MILALQEEIRLQSSWLSDLPIETIYLGGGTPSLLEADEINRIFDTIFSCFARLDLKECTLEANPDDLGNRYLRELKTTPVNRLSIGVQSFHDSDLRYMNRAHNAQQADYAIKAAQDLGFERLTIDLIYGTPGLTDILWKQNLRTVKELDIPHFSAYALTVEEGTQLHHSITKKQAQPVEPEQAAQQFEILMEMAEANGYVHYEISNLAKEGEYAVHNTNYWKGVPYLGIGPSAHSFNGRKRRWNIANNALYITGLLREKKLHFEEEVLTEVQQLNEYLMTSLRTIWGTDLRKIANEWGADYSSLVLKFSEESQEKKHLVLQDGRLYLTAAGKLFADRIAAELFIDAES